MSEMMIWANLLHLSYNMWNDREPPTADAEAIYARPFLRFDESLWNDLLQQMSAAGLNMVVIDVGDGLQFTSHPEISVTGAWSHDNLQCEIAKMRALGLEPIPKLNFSTAHDTWLGPYSRMVSTPKYYEVCAHLIHETLEAFEHPRLLHLGMDEETASHQASYNYAVMRQHDLWWHDLNFLVDEVEKHDARAWVWSDYIWHHAEEFVRRMPKSVMQSNWYYGDNFETFAAGDANEVYVRAYDLLEAHGFDQIPTGGNWTTPHNMQRTVEYARRHISPARLKGCLGTAWHCTQEARRAPHEALIAQMGVAKQSVEKNSL